MVRIQISGIKKGWKYTCMPSSGGWRGSEMIASMAGDSINFHASEDWASSLLRISTTSSCSKLEG
jgi:hypothetical protein